MKKLFNFNLKFRLMCILLVITSFTCISLARYISSRPINQGVSIKNIHASIVVGEQSNGMGKYYEFFNTPYMLNGSVMNLPQKSNFVINNLDYDYDKKEYQLEPSAVDLKYELVFYVPKDFASVTAIQFANVATDGSETAATPLYLLSDFINNAATAPKKIDVKGKFSAVDSNGFTYDYGSLAYPNEEKPIDQTFTAELQSDAVKKWVSNDGTTVLIETEQIEASVDYTFQCFSGQPNNGIAFTRLAPMYVCEVKKIDFYKIRISRPEFLLGGGSKSEQTYCLRTITTKEIENSSATEIGITFNEFMKNRVADSLAFTYENKSCKVQNITEPTDKNSYTNSTVGKTATSGERIYVDTVIQKNYPVRINCVFTQTSIN